MTNGVMVVAAGWRRAVLWLYYEITMTTMDCRLCTRTDVSNEGLRRNAAMVRR